MARRVIASPNVSASQQQLAVRAELTPPNRSTVSKQNSIPRKSHEPDNTKDKIPKVFLVYLQSSISAKKSRSNQNFGIWATRQHRSLNKTFSPYIGQRISLSSTQCEAETIWIFRFKRQAPHYTLTFKKAFLPLAPKAVPDSSQNTRLKSCSNVGKCLSFLDKSVLKLVETRSWGFLILRSGAKLYLKLSTVMFLFHTRVHERIPGGLIGYETLWFHFQDSEELTSWVRLWQCHQNKGLHADRKPARVSSVSFTTENNPAKTKRPFWNAR